MKKTNIAIFILVAIILFSGIDYFLNISRTARPDPITVDTQDSYPNLTEALIESNPVTLDYRIIKRHRTTQIFEKIDLSAIENIRIYRSQLEKEGRLPIILYEIQGSKNQGGLTYLAIKLAFANQIDATENLNEKNEYGNGDFYFNDLNVPNIAFLVVQVGDNLYGFQFNRANEQDFSTVRGMINTLMTNFKS